MDIGLYKINLHWIELRICHELYWEFICVFVFMNESGSANALNLSNSVNMVIGAVTHSQLSLVVKGFSYQSPEKSNASFDNIMPKQNQKKVCVYGGG